MLQLSSGRAGRYLDMTLPPSNQPFFPPGVPLLNCIPKSKRHKYHSNNPSKEDSYLFHHSWKVCDGFLLSQRTLERYLCDNGPVVIIFRSRYPTRWITPLSGQDTRAKPKLKQNMCNTPIGSQFLPGHSKYDICSSQHLKSSTHFFPSPKIRDNVVSCRIIWVSHVISTNQTTLPLDFTHSLGAINVFSDRKLAIKPVILRVPGSGGHGPVDENRSTRNFLMFMNTTNKLDNKISQGSHSAGLKIKIRQLLSLKCPRNFFSLNIYTNACDYGL